MKNVEQSAVTIRPMTHSDIHAVVALHRKISKGHSPLSYKDIAATDPGGPLDVSFVAEVGGNVVGFVMSRLVYVMIPFTEVCLLKGLLVDPDYQSRGIGVRLLGKLVGYCQDEGINTIRALVPESNDELQHFVERLGFNRSTIVNYDKTF